VPTLPNTPALSFVTGAAAGNGDNTLIAAPAAGLRTVITSLVIQNETTTATTMILKDGTTAIYRCLGQNQGDGLAMNLGIMPWKLSAASVLVLNLSGANSCGYSVSYYTEPAN
jgi:hypothetical protein